MAVLSASELASQVCGVTSAGRQQSGRRQGAVRGRPEVAEPETHHGAGGWVRPCLCADCNTALRAAADQNIVTVHISLHALLRSPHTPIHLDTLFDDECASKDLTSAEHLRPRCRCRADVAMRD